ncbi:MAG: amino acid ABC transporter substrate-binding protein [Methanomicrobium sp.]|nr:amino acid ABC transporter substrate-binding protein [Methanomicrobium sp.]
MHKKILPVSLLAIAIIAAVIAGCTGTPASPASTASDSQNGTADANGIGKTVAVGIELKYPPYSYIDKDGKPQGFDIESAKWIAEDQGLNIEFRTVEWDGIIPALLAKKIDMVYSGMTINPERAEKVAFSEIYWVTNQGIAVKKNSPLTLDDVMSGKAKIGTQRGSTAEGWIRENLIGKGILESGKLVLYDNFPFAITDLESGRIDAAMYDTPFVKKNLKGRDLEFLGIVENTEEDYAVAVRKEDTELLKKINAGLKNLKESPKWAELVEKYGLDTDD